MEILGIGPIEFLFIVIIALVLLGPKEMERAGRTVGKWLNTLVKSDAWQVMRDTSKVVSTLPTRLMREANLEEMNRELNISADPLDMDELTIRNNTPEDPRQKPRSSLSAPAQTGNAILPSKSHPYTPGKPSAVKASEKAANKPVPKKQSTARTALGEPAVKTNKSKAGKNTDA